MGLACWQADQLISRILEDVDANNWKVFLSGDNNFRYSLYPEYKANRRDVPKPKHLEGVREYLVLDHGASISDGYEADDSMGIYASRTDLADEVVICSLDKDLLQLPGRHYNFHRREFSSVSRTLGFRNLYEQLLVGDTADNIKGCSGVGKARAPKLLDGCNTEDEFVTCCWQAYERAGHTEDFFIMNARLLYILRHEDDHWTPPLDLII